MQQNKKCAALQDPGRENRRNQWRLKQAIYTPKGIGNWKPKWKKKMLQANANLNQENYKRKHAKSGKNIYVFQEKLLKAVENHRKRKYKL